VISTAEGGTSRERAESELARHAGSRETFEARPASVEDLSGEALRWAEVVFLSSEAAVDDALTAALSGAVDGGTGLVVAAGTAPRAWGALAEVLALWTDPAAIEAAGGRQPTRPDGGPQFHPPAPSRTMVSVRSQSHPVTQCVNDFLHPAPLDPVALRSGAEVLAVALDAAASGASSERGSPVVWTTSRGRGRVAVTRLDPCRGASADLVRAIIARACQWAAHRDVTVRLEGEYRLRAEVFRGPPADPGEAPPERRGFDFYRGRQVAPFMSYHGAGWLERPEREAEELPDRVVESLRLAPGQTAVDLGAGVGYFALRMARRVAPDGKVLAVEIQKEMLERLERRAAEAGIENVVPVLATEDDPKLPEGAADLVLMVDVYHELSSPEPVLAAVLRCLKPNGRLVLVEYRGEDPRIAIKPLHRTLERQVRAEVEANGFRWLHSNEFLPVQRILTFTKRPHRGD
jgi:SAM-dependent methyltransferase